MQTTRTVAIRDRALYVDDRRVPLISGDFHFWRVQKSNWEAILDTCLGLGVRMISTYVAWNYHELEPGRFDFTGETCPERDLRGFLDLCKERDLYVVARPGPYIYAEWPHGGPPERAAVLPRLSREFLEETAVYLDAVCDVLNPYLATRGNGPIALVQVDNEPWPNLRARCEEIGASGGGGMFADWLKQEYGALEKLNRAWRADYAAWDEPAIYFEECYINRSIPLNGRVLPADRFTQRYVDGQRFVEYYANLIVETIAGMVRERGIDVPLYMNGWHPYAQNFALAMKTVDLAGVDGLHRHPQFFDPSAPEFEDDYLTYTESLKMTVHDTGGIGYAAEMGMGHPTVGVARRLKYAPKPQNNLFDYLFYMAHGMKAWNWYILVDRDGWVCAAVDQFGRETAYAPPIREALKVAEAIDVSRLESLKCCALITHKGHRFTDSGNWSRVFNALKAADLDFDLVDPAAKPPEATLAFYGGAQWLPRAAAATLRAYVESGGALVFFSHVPSLDEFGDPLDLFDLPDPDMVRPVNTPFALRCGAAETRIEDGGHYGTVCLTGYRSLPGGAEPIEAVLSDRARAELVDIGLRAGEQKTVPMGYRKAFGRGEVIVLGINPDPRIAEFARRLSGRSFIARTDAPHIQTHAWKIPDGRIALFAVNLSAQGAYARIEVDAGAIGLRGDVSVADVRRGRDTAFRAGEENAFTVFIPEHDVWVGALSGE